MKLYDYHRSSACYRVRIALNLKKINFSLIPIDLLTDLQHQQDYLDINPQGLVPTLDENGHILNQSLAIIEYLEYINPEPALLPTNPLGRAQVRSLALTIACDMHPLNNLRVLQQLKQQFSATELQINTWYHHWLKQGFDTIEAQLSKLPRKNSVCYGNEPGLADICLIPQIYNAKRFDFNIDKYPIIDEINQHCLTIAAFIDAAPN